MNTPTYCTLEQFKVAAGMKGVDQNNTILRLLASASRQIEKLLHRFFFPIVQARAYEWPAPMQNTSLRLYLGADLLAPTTITSGGAAFTQYVLQPYNEGPPYSRIEVDLSSDDTFEQATIRQLSIIVTGKWGYCMDTAVVGALVAAIDNVQTTLIVPNAALVGIGDLIFIGDEALLVTGRSLLVNTSALTAGVAADDAVVLIPVTVGTTFHEGEIITVDAEKMYVVGIAGNNLTVKRAYDGSVLALHLIAAPVYIERTLTVTRGACGTTAVLHLITAPITRNIPPGLISDWCLAEALSRFEQEQSGYGRSIGQGEGAFEAKGVGLKDLRAQCMDAYYRARGPVAI
jgi:hypothetical protein